MTHGKHLTKTAAGMVAVLLFVFWTLPDNPIQIEKARPDDTTYRGVFHVHSTESDGGGTAEEIAEAARGADLDVVVLTMQKEALKTLDDLEVLGSSPIRIPPAKHSDGKTSHYQLTRSNGSTATVNGEVRG